MVHASTHSSNRQDRRRQRRSQQILDGAMRLIEEQGLEALTIQRLAGELDWAVGAMYRYFRSKDALLAALQRRVIEDLSRRLRQTLAAFGQALEGGDHPAGTRALAALLTASDLHRGLLADAPSQYRLLSGMLADPRQLLDDREAGPNVQTFLGLLGQLGALMEQAAAAGALRPGGALERAVLLLAAVQGALQMDKLSRFSPALASERLVEHLVRTLLQGWGADPAALDQARRLADRTRARLAAPKGGASR
jgi:AcrR family transcriptional regulator